MKQFLLICVGSRGDAEPVCALAARLLSANHHVVLFLQEDLVSLAPKSSSILLRVHTLPFTQMDFYKYAGNPTRGTNDPNPRVKFIGAVVDLIEFLVLPCTESVLEAASNGCHAIVTSALARNVAFLVAQKHNIPCALLHYQPFVPNPIFPHYSQHDECLEALQNYRDGVPPTMEQRDSYRQSHLGLERVQFDFLNKVLPEWYEKFDLAYPWTWEDLEQVLVGTVPISKMLPTIHIVNAYSEEMAPGTAIALEAGPRVHYTGALADHYIPSECMPDTSLVSFLARHVDFPPVCIGFGSMPYSQTLMILQVLSKLQVPAVLVGKALRLPSPSSLSSLEIDKEWMETNIHQIDSAPYAWLLPQCFAMLCHGGAGVVHATLRAGIPCIIAPFFGDQFFFADLVTQLGVGARAGKQLATASADDFETALQLILEHEECRDRARQVGQRIQDAPLGVDRTVAILEEIIQE